MATWAHPGSGLVSTLGAAWQRGARKLIWLALAVALGHVVAWAVIFLLTLRGLANENVSYWFFSDYHSRLYGPIELLLWAAVLLVAAFPIARGRRLWLVTRVPVPLLLLALFGVALVFLPDVVPHRTVFASLVRTASGYVDASPGSIGPVERYVAVGMLNSELRGLAQLYAGLAIVAVSVLATYLLKGPQVTNR